MGFIQYHDVSSQNMEEKGASCQKSAHLIDNRLQNDMVGGVSVEMPLNGSNHSAFIGPSPGCLAPVQEPIPRREDPFKASERNRQISLFRLLCQERSILSRNDLIQLEGVVAKVLGGGTMEIQCDNNITVRGVLSGRMKKHRIKVMVGDKVQVSVSPYDTSHGLITYRF